MTRRRTARPARRPASAARRLSAASTSGHSFTNVPGGTANWTFTGGRNYNDQSGTVGHRHQQGGRDGDGQRLHGVYDAAAHGATGTATGVGGVDLSAGLDLGASFTNVPGGTANWTFTGGTQLHDQSGTAAIVITKADATVTVNGYTGRMTRRRTGRPARRPASAAWTLSSRPRPRRELHQRARRHGELDVHRRTRNYTDQSGTAAIVINKADATVDGHRLHGTYDAAAHGATGTATGVGGDDLSRPRPRRDASPTCPAARRTGPSRTRPATTTTRTARSAIVITKADATVSVTGYTGRMTRRRHGATGTATGVGGVDLSRPRPRRRRSPTCPAARRPGRSRRGRQLQRRERHGRDRHHQGGRD